MEIILSNNCKSLTGSMGRGFGYHIQRRKNGFFAKRNTKGDVPPDGHWRFILSCACLAQNGLHISDVKVRWSELKDALWEAGYYISAAKVDRNATFKDKFYYNASDVLRFKERWLL